MRKKEKDNEEGDQRIAGKEAQINERIEKKKRKRTEEREMGSEVTHEKKRGELERKRVRRTEEEGVNSGRGSSAGLDIDQHALGCLQLL